MSEEKVPWTEIDMSELKQGDKVKRRSTGREATVTEIWPEAWPRGRFDIRYDDNGATGSYCAPENFWKVVEDSV